MRDFVQEYRYADGRRIYLMAEGRLVNISAAEGHPAAVMDMSFANQALSVEYLQGALIRADARRLQRAGRDRPAGCRHQACLDGHHHRYPDRGAGSVPGLLAVRHLSASR